MASLAFDLVTKKTKVITQKGWHKAKKAKPGLMPVLA